MITVILAKYSKSTRVCPPLITEKIIADLLNSSLSKEQEEEIESKELISDASQKYDLDAEVLEK